MQPRVSRVPGADGMTLNLLEWSSDGVPLLLLHGFGNEAHIWDDLAPTLAPHYRVMALDLRGHGDSDHHPGGAYDYDDHLADLEAIVAHLGIERAVVVAHSLGGRVAMLYGGRHSERLAGLVIVDSAPELDRRGTTRITLETAKHQDPSFRSVSEYEQLLVHNYPAATPAAIRRMAKYGVKQREDGRFVLKMDTVFRGAVGASSEAIDPSILEERHERYQKQMWQALEKLECPTLVVRGAASDIMSPDVADRMVDEVLKNGQLAVVPQAGHSVMTDNPEAFAEAVCRFVLGDG